MQNPLPVVKCSNIPSRGKENGDRILHLNEVKMHLF